MIKTFVTSFKISFVQNANTSIYFLQRVPFIGKKMPETLYKQVSLKLVFGTISQVLSLLISFFYKSLYLGFIILLPSVLIGRDIIEPVSVFLHILFFLSFVLGTIMDSTVLIPDKSAFDMIILMRTDARQYYLSQILYKRIEGMVQLILPLIITGLIIGFSPFEAFVLLIELAALRLIGEWLHIYVYDKTEKIFIKNGYLIGALVIAGIILAYGLPITGHVINLQPVLFNIFSVVISLLLGTVALVYLWKYRKYNFIAKALLTKDIIFDEDTILSEITFADVKLDEEKLFKEEIDIDLFQEKHGYDYLNSLFFQRYRRILIRPIKTRVVIIFAVFLNILLIQLFLPESKPTIFESIKGSSPIMVIIMYLLSTGERITKAMFYNCDVSLLRYSFYRERMNILSNFTLRLKKVVFLNIIPALAIILVLIILVITSGFSSSLISLVPLFLSILSLACFFSIHHLFMYYAIQPYTPQLKVKSPLFKFINMVVWLLSYISLQIKTTSIYFTIGVLIITVLYIAVAMIITYRVAPRTFRLK